MKWFIEFGAVRVGAVIQSVCAHIDFDVLSLPGGSLIAVVLWLYASAGSSMRRASMQLRASRTNICGGPTCGARRGDPRDQGPRCRVLLQTS
jgi:hypothetical protein